MGETEGANRASAYVADEIFVTNKVNPTILLMSQAMTEWLGPAFASDNERLVVWIEPAVARDSQVEMKVWDLLARFGICTINEMRQAFRLPTIPGGNQLVVQGGTGRQASQQVKAANVSQLMRGINPYTLKALTSGRVYGSGANGSNANGKAINGTGGTGGNGSGRF